MLVNEYKPELNSSVLMTKFNMMYVLLYFEVFIERERDIRHKIYLSARDTLETLLPTGEASFIYIHVDRNNMRSRYCWQEWFFLV